jgi:hypothetical protein
MHKSATKCNETLGKWCQNKHGASKIIDTLETYQPPRRASRMRLACRFAKATSSPSSLNKLNAEAAPSFYGPLACIATACKLAVKPATTAPKRGLLPRSDGGETLNAASRRHGEGGQRHPSWQPTLRSPRLWPRRASTFPLWRWRRPAPPTVRSSMMMPLCRASRPQHQ